MDNIVVGIDGSKSAQSAARWAAKQAQQSGARVIAVYAVPRTELWSLSAAQVNIDELLAEIQADLDGPWTAALRKAGVEHTTQLVRGDPATELLRVGKRAGASMLVLGSKGHSALADLVVGGTVHKVINRSNIPVMVIPTPTTAKRRVAPRKATTGRSSRS